MCSYRYTTYSKQTTALDTLTLRSYDLQCYDLDRSTINYVPCGGKRDIHAWFSREASSPIKWALLKGESNEQ